MPPRSQELLGEVDLAGIERHRGLFGETEQLNVHVPQKVW
jgi:hypothetical protein